MLRSLTAWLNRGPNGRQGNLEESELVLGPNAYFKGLLQCGDTIIIEGVVEDSRIETSANIIVAETAQVRCDFSARIVSIRGRYSGTLIADRAEILVGAEVDGQVHVNTIYIDENAVMNAEMYLLGTARETLGAATDEITTDVVTRTPGQVLKPPPEIGT